MDRARRPRVAQGGALASELEGLLVPPPVAPRFFAFVVPWPISASRPVTNVPTPRHGNGAPPLARPPPSYPLGPPPPPPPRPIDGPMQHAIDATNDGTDERTYVVLSPELNKPQPTTEMALLYPLGTKATTKATY